LDSRVFCTVTISTLKQKQLANLTTRLHSARMFVNPQSNLNARKPDRLVAELGKVEGRLQAWITASGRNAQLFRRDPIAAMREAGLEIEHGLMCELERIMGGIAAKLQK
jgi:hypothetical protein